MRPPLPRQLLGQRAPWLAAKPSPSWTGQRIIEAFPLDTAPRYLVRDRDGNYGGDFARRVDGMGIEQAAEFEVGQHCDFDISDRSSR